MRSSSAKMRFTLITKILAASLLAGSFVFSSVVYAACNLIPGTIKTFNSTLGATNRPFAAPGESIEVRLRPCDSGSGLAATAEGNVVTVVFTPPGGSAVPNAVILTADADCSAIDPLLAACSAQLGGGSATCVSAPYSGLQLVERDNIRNLRFSFPDTDTLLASPDDDVTLAGPARIAVTDSAAPLPCGLATQSCAAQSGVLACIDGFYANDGKCGVGTPLATFPSFTALPPANDYQADCVTDSPPCTATAENIRAALDSAGNLLTPFQWSGILVRDAGVPVPRLLQSRIKSPVPFTLNDPVYIGSYTPEGGLLPPIFEPQRDVGVMSSDTVALFGSADAPYTILRFARNQGTCSGGGRNTLACSNDTDCPGGTCTSTGNNFDFSMLPQNPSGGPIVFARQSSGGFCQDDVSTLCTANCGMDAPCVNYLYSARIPVPLEGLAASSTTRTFSIRESIDGVDRNGDSDTNDTVVVLRDRATGAGQDLGAPAECSLGGSPAGRAIIRVSDPPYSFPAVEVENNIVAFLESESSSSTSASRCDITGDGDVADSILRVVRLGGNELSASLASQRAVDPSLIVNGRTHAISNGRVFFRTSEAAMAQRGTELISVVAATGNASGNPVAAGLTSFSAVSVTSEGRYVAFQSSGAVLDSSVPGGGVFVRDRQTGTTVRVDLASGRVPGPLSGGAGSAALSAGPSISADGRFVAFSSIDYLAAGVSKAQSYPDVYVHDRDFDGNGTFDESGAGKTSTELISTALSASSSQDAFLSADGRFVAFVQGFNNGHDQVRVRDRCLSFGQPVGGCTATTIDVAPEYSFEHVVGISADGRYVAFTTQNALLAEDTNSTQNDIYVRDLQTGGLELASVRSDGTQAAIFGVAPGTGTISADGRFVAFASIASDLVAGDTNGALDAFVHDRVTGITERVSVTTGGAQANASAIGSVAPRLSADGRFVVFRSDASNLVADDTNGYFDIFVRDRLSATTERVSLRDDGLQAAHNGVSTEFSCEISGDGRTLVFQTGDSLASPADSNSGTDIYARGLNSADPLQVDDLLFPNGSLTDSVLEILDTVSSTLTTTCPAEEVSVENGMAAYLRPESAMGTANCPSGSLNVDSDVRDSVVQFWPGSGISQNLGIAATAVSLSSSHVAALVSESGENDTDLNGDSDTNDTVVQIHPAGSGSWANTGQAADVVKMTGSFALFVTPEADQGGAPLNGDADSSDRVLQIFDAATSQLAPCSAAVGGNCSAGVRQAAEEFVVGEPTTTSCGMVQLVAFRTRESAQGSNLNSTANGIASGDNDTTDDVLLVYDLVSGTLQNTGQAVTPCQIPECDPRFPYKVEGGRVRFLTAEAEQGNRDLTGEGNLGLALQLYDFCGDITTTLGEVKNGNGDADPLAVHDESVTYVVQSGRCVLDQPIPCDPNNDACGGGASCSTDKCSLGACNPGTLHCVDAPGTACTNDGDCNVCVEWGGLCSSDGDCARCVVHQPGSCTNSDDCASGSTCHAALIVAATGINDQDDDGVPDDQDNCVAVPNTNQSDLDEDRVGDACDAQTCGNSIPEAPEECDDGVAGNSSTIPDVCRPTCRNPSCGDDVVDSGEACDDGNTVGGDGCQSDCTICFIDGNQTAGELCDDGNFDDGDGCDNNCTPSGCGNGVVTGSEICDDNNSVDGDGCDSNCTPTGCGNGVMTAGEACDDSNTDDGDGCDSNCSQTTCGNGILTAAELCDDGNLINSDGCDNNCTFTGCLNGVVSAGETCDDGNFDDGDGCDNNCTPTGCGNNAVTNGEICDDGNLVSGDGCDSNCSPTGCGNHIVTADEVCDDGNFDDGDGCDNNCTPTGCGNGIVSGAEACDDGNSTNGDGCDANCTASGCPNGIVTAGETCDDGNALDGDDCDSNCTPTGCGNAILTAGEVCDDGNLASGDGCDENCTPTGCPNGIVTVGEACDDANNVDGDGCDNNCSASACGNGVVAGGEACDDGNGVDDDGCDSNCTVTVCGNGIATGAELCDDGNLDDGDGCDSNCTLSGCGNGIATGSEICDDGNVVEADGCDSNCSLSACGNGIAAGSEACDDGNHIDGDGCDSNCTPTTCGNAIVTVGEVCDDGNGSDGDGCDSNCSMTGCGNGIQTMGEVCDDGNLDDGDGCDTNCTVTSCGNGIVTGFEECDDGNPDDGDGCDTNCTVTSCGNSIVAGGETCDDGNLDSGDGCDANCTPTGCGNGIITAGEGCDDGNSIDDDGCSNSCVAALCGNTIVEGSEVCDDGNPIDGDGCTRQCRPYTSAVGDCQEALGKASQKYLASRLKSLQKCRNALNKGKSLYADASGSIAISNPADCATEMKTAGKLAKLGLKTRGVIAGKCTDAAIAALSACGGSLDAITDGAGASGCLLSTYAMSIETLLDQQYGRVLTKADKDGNSCQATIAKAGAAYVATRVSALRACRNDLNSGKGGFVDVAETISLNDPAQCATEVKTAAAIAKAGGKLRDAVAKKCTNTLVADLASACATTIDGLVDPTGSAGCLVSGGVLAADTLVDAAY